MEYTPMERLARLWELVGQDPDCVECEAEMRNSEHRLAEYTEELPLEERLLLWAMPATQHTYFHRVLEVVSRQMCLPEESENRPDH